MALPAADVAVTAVGRVDITCAGRVRPGGRWVVRVILGFWC